MHPESPAFLDACRRQDRKAQQALYNHFRLPLYRMCLRYARDRQEAEDFLHDGMLKVFQEFGQYSGRGALGGWVRRVVLNVILQTLRRRPRIVSEADFPDEATPDGQELDTQLDQLSGRQIFELIRQLPLGYRTVFSLYYLDDHSHQEIAAALNITTGSSKSQLHKAKRHLRALIEKNYPAYQYRS